MNNKRKNIIDGLPVSYDFNYVTKTNKSCYFCQKKIKLTEIEENAIACSEEFEFMHKDCVFNHDYELVYSNPKEITSMIKLKKLGTAIEIEKATKKQEQKKHIGLI